MGVCGLNAPKKASRTPEPPSPIPAASGDTYGGTDGGTDRQATPSRHIVDLAAEFLSIGTWKSGLPLDRSSIPKSRAFVILSAVVGVPRLDRGMQRPAKRNRVAEMPAVEAKTPVVKHLQTPRTQQPFRFPTGAAPTASKRPGKSAGLLASQPGKTCDHLRVPGNQMMPPRGLTCRGGSSLPPRKFSHRTAPWSPESCRTVRPVSSRKGRSDLRRAERNPEHQGRARH